MSPLEHLNAFCVLFTQLKSICESDTLKKESQEAGDIRKKMYGHYPFLDDKMVKYLDTFTSALISYGFNFDEMKNFNKIDVSDLDSIDEVKVTGSFKCAKLVDVSVNGKIYNYNEYSKPITDLPPNEFQQLKQKTIMNIKNAQIMQERGIKPQASRQPMTWSLPDNERDW